MNIKKICLETRLFYEICYNKRYENLIGQIETDVLKKYDFMEI